MYCLRPLQASDKENLQSLLKNSFATSASLSDRINWKWFQREACISMVAEDKAGTIVSQYTVVPTRLVMRGKCCLAGQSIDMATLPAHRGRRLISMLSNIVYREIDASGYTCTFGVSNRMGLNVDNHASTYGYRSLGAFETVYAWAKKDKKCLWYKISLHDLQEQRASFGADCVRDKSASYLRWRYASYPHAVYDAYEIHIGNTLVQVIIKKNAYKLYVIDIITNHECSDGEMMMLFVALRHLAWQLRRPLVSCTFFGYPQFARVLGRSPWKQARGKTHFLTVRDSESKNVHDQQWGMMLGDII